MFIIYLAAAFGSFEEFSEFEEFEEFISVDEVKEEPKVSRDEMIAAQENRDDLIAFVHAFPEDEYGIVEIDDGAFYARKGDRLQDSNQLNILLERYVQEGATAIDYGAENGLRAYTLSRLVGAKGKVIAFETRPLLFREMFWNLILNKVHNVQLYCSVLGEREKRLDSFHFENVALIRINAGGREDSVLKGAVETIQKYRPVLIISILGGIAIEKADKFIRQELQNRMDAIHHMGYSTQRISEAEYLALPSKN